MDYPFYIKPVCAIPLDVIAELLEAALRLDYQRHPHFSDRQPVRTYMRDDYQDDLGKIVYHRVMPLLPFEKYSATMWEVNELRARQSIHEHSDITSQDGVQG